MRTPAGFVFDMHGTLLYEDPDVPEQWRLLSACLGVGLEPFREAFLRDLNAVMAGRTSSDERYRRVLGALGLDDGPASVDRLRTKEFEIRRSAVRLYPETAGTLKTLRSRGFKLGLLSNCTPLWADILPEISLVPAFDSVLLSCAAGMAKPDPAFFRAILSKLDLCPENTVYVGDGGDSELEAASDLGMTAVFIRQEPAMRRQGDPTRYHAVIRSLGELLQCLEKPEKLKGEGGSSWYTHGHK